MKNDPLLNKPVVEYPENDIFDVNLMSESVETFAAPSTSSKKLPKPPPKAKTM